MTGTITKKKDRGFCFVKADGTDKSYFLHARQIKNADFEDVSEGDRVDFQVGLDRGRECALDAYLS